MNILLTSIQWAVINRISRGMHLIAWFICVLVAGDANIAIALTLLRTRRRVQPQHEPLRNKICRRRETKLTRIIAFVVGAYLLLNMSVLFVTIYHQILKQDVKTYNHYSWTETPALLNSCTNPLICFRKEPGDKFVRQL